MHIMIGLYTYYNINIFNSLKYKVGQTGKCRKMFAFTFVQDA